METIVNYKLEERCVKMDWNINGELIK